HRVHLAERLGVAVRREDRIIAETAVPARRPDDGPVDLADAHHRLASRPAQRKRADESGAPIARAARLELTIDALHGETEVLGRSAPARRVYAGSAAESRDLEPRIVGDREHARGDAGGHRLDLGVFGEARAGLLGLRQSEPGGGDAVDADRREQLSKLARFALVVGGDHDRVAAPELSYHGLRDGELLQPAPIGDAL